MKKLKYMRLDLIVEAEEGYKDDAEIIHGIQSIPGVIGGGLVIDDKGEYRLPRVLTVDEQELVGEWKDARGRLKDKGSVASEKEMDIEQQTWIEAIQFIGRTV